MFVHLHSLQMDGVSPELRIAISLERFSGRWYETARTRGIPFEPRGTTDVTATYSWDGRTFGIHNEALLNCQPISWHTKVKRIDNAFNTRFIIEVPPPPGTNLPAGEGVYRILMLDTDEYKWAVVASGERDGWVWVLSREQLMTPDRWRNIFDRLEREFGYDPRRLEYTVHTRQPALPSPPELPDFEVPEVEKPKGFTVPLGDNVFRVTFGRK